MLPTTLTGAALAVTGHREEGNKEIGVAAKGGGNQSFLLSLLSFWSLNLTLCVSVLLCLLVFVFPRGSPAFSVKRIPPSCAKKNSCSARDPEQHQLAGQACSPCHPHHPCIGATWGCHGCPRDRWLLLVLSAGIVRVVTGFTSNLMNQLM